MGITLKVSKKATPANYEALALEVDEWYTNGCSSCSFGDDPEQLFGWGGTATPAVAPGDLMTPAQMNELIDRINIGVGMTSVTGTLDRITDSTVLPSEFNAAVAKELLVRAQKNTINASELSQVSGTSNARAAVYTNTINATFRYTFSDFNDARYFFNSGGTLDIDGTITGYSTGWTFDGEGINEILTTMGVVSMDYTAVTQSGSGGSTSSIGYYDLTETYQNMFTQTGTGVYSNASLTLEARRSASGNYVEIRVSITPEVGRTVNGTTTINADYKKLDDQTSGDITLQITDPTSVTVVETF